MALKHNNYDNNDNNRILTINYIVYYTAGTFKHFMYNSEWLGQFEDNTIFRLEKLTFNNNRELSQGQTCNKWYGWDLNPAT